MSDASKAAFARRDRRPNAGLGRVERDPAMALAVGIPGKLTAAQKRKCGFDGSPSGQRQSSLSRFCSFFDQGNRRTKRRAERC